MRRLRWIVFAEQLRSSATLDIDAARREIEEGDFELMHPTQAQQDTRKRVQIATARLGLEEMIAGKEATRATLWPEDKVEPVAEE